MCAGFCRDEVPPSPKFHDHEVAPVDVSVQTNVVTPATPAEGLTRNDAVTDVPIVTLAVFDCADSPALLNAVTYKRYVPAARLEIVAPRLPAARSGDRRLNP